MTGLNSTTTILPQSDHVSPVTLSPAWNRVANLLCVVGLAVIGSVGNVYMISAVMIEDHLKKRGNTFLVNVALADLLITGVVMPASAVVILAGLKDSPPVCRVQWFLAILCWVVTVLTLTATSVENYARLCLSPDFYAKITTTRITITIFITWLLGTAAATVLVIYDLGPDYCTRKPTPILPYQATIAGLFVVLPVVITSFFYVRTTYQVRLAKSNPNFKPPIAFSWDYSLMKTNIYSCILLFAFWLPFCIIIGISSSSPETISVGVFNSLAWVALSKSCFNNFLYCITNRHFRNAYINLFHYCCCKTTVAFSRRPRGEVARPSGDVRVHIIPGYNMYSYTSPQRSRDSNKNPTCKRSVGTCRSTRSNGRDVYQL